MIRLTKIGNLKIGIVRNGKPIATTRILITDATKDGEENFKIKFGANPEGEESIRVSLPFDDIDLNFEEKFVGFVTIDEIDYILKASEGENIIGMPLYIENENNKVIDFGKLTKASIKKYNLVKTGFLMLHVEGYSGYGEVFYFKTQSINSMETIKSQLRTLSTLTGGYLASLPLKMSAHRKDTSIEQDITYISLSYDGDMFGESNSLNEYIINRKYRSVDIKRFEELYLKERTPLKEDIISISKLKAKIEIAPSVYAEIKEFGAEEEKKKTKEEIFVEDFFKAKKINKIPVATGVILLKKVGEKNFKGFFSTPKTLPEVFELIQEQ